MPPPAGDQTLSVCVFFRLVRCGSRSCVKRVWVLTSRVWSASCCCCCCSCSRFTARGSPVTPTPVPVSFWPHTTMTGTNTHHTPTHTHIHTRTPVHPSSLCVSISSRNILDDFREAYYWLRLNTGQHARIMSWWDYGYQIAGMANRTTLVDNNTWNNSHIALVRHTCHRKRR